MRSRTTRIALMAVAVLGIAIVGTALAAGASHHRGNAHVASVAVASDIAAKIGAFRSPDTGVGDAGSLATLETLISKNDGPLSGTPDWNAARSAPISGSTGRAWIVPSGENVCLFVPMASSGFGVSCKSLSQIQAGQAVVVTGGPTPVPGQAHAPATNGTTTVAQIVADGGAAPTVTDNGTRTTLATADNVAAAVVPTRDTFAAGGQSVGLSTLGQPAS